MNPHDELTEILEIAEDCMDIDNNGNPDEFMRIAILTKEAINKLNKEG